MVVQGWGGGDCGVASKEYKVSFRGDENVLRLTFMMLTNICKYTKNH